MIKSNGDPMLKYVILDMTGTSLTVNYTLVRSFYVRQILV